MSIHLIQRFIILHVLQKPVGPEIKGTSRMDIESIEKTWSRQKVTHTLSPGSKSYFLVKK